MSSNWADDSGDLPPPMPGGGGGSSAPAAAPSGGCVSRLRQRQRSQSPADASAPDAPLTTTLDPFHARRGKPAYVPPHQRNRPAGQRDRGDFGRDDRRGGTSPDAGAPHFFSRPRPPTTAPRRRSAAGCDFPFFPTASATESRAIGPGGDDIFRRDPRPRCEAPRGDSPARSSADAARDTAVRGSEQTLNARENGRAGSAPRCAFRGSARRRGRSARRFFGKLFLSGRFSRSRPPRRAKRTV